ncbi:MAG: hypothetical protein ACK55I_50420, partial [bacterium]
MPVVFFQAKIGSRTSPAIELHRECRRRQLPVTLAQPGAFFKPLRARWTAAISAQAQQVVFEAPHVGRRLVRTDNQRAGFRRRPQAMAAADQRR